MAKVQESIFTMEKVIKDEEVTPYGFSNVDCFLDEHYPNIEMMAEYPEEPSEFNGEYPNGEFNVLHTIIGNIDGIEGLGYWRVTYNFVDVQIPDKLLVVELALDIEDSDEYGINEYGLGDVKAYFVPKGEYIDALLRIEDVDELF